MTLTPRRKTPIAPSTPTSAQSGEPSDLAVLLRDPDRPLPYGIGLRWLDVIAGRRDGRVHLAGPQPDAYRLLENATAWQRHNQHRLAERLAAEDLMHDSLSLSLSSRQTELTGAIASAEAAVTEAEQALVETEAIEVNLSARRSTESHLSDEQVAKRRREEHAKAVLAPARARVTAAQAALKALRDEQPGVTAMLDRLRAVIDKRKDRLTQFHGRRALAYERAYLRHANLASTPMPRQLAQPRTASTPVPLDRRRSNWSS